MKSLPSGQYVPGSSPVHRLDPRVKLVCLIILMAVVLGARSLMGYALALAVVAGAAALTRLPIGRILGPVRRLWLFFVTIFAMNALFFSGGDPIFAWWIISITPQGLAQGLRVVINVTLIIILANALTMTTAPVELTRALESLLRPLRLIFVPVEEVAMIISLAIRFIPTLLEEAEAIKMAQIARGARFESKKLTQRAASVLPLVIPIFISAFRRADELAMAMEARGYRGAKERTPGKTLPMGLGDLAACGLCAVMCLSQFVFVPLV